MDDAQSQAARAKADLDIKYRDLIADGTIADIIAGTLSDHGSHVAPNISIHVAPAQKNNNLILRLWNETADYRDRGVDITIFYYRPGRREPVAFRG